MPQFVTIPLGGRDYAGQPLPQEASYVVAGAGDSTEGGWPAYEPKTQGTAEGTGWPEYKPQPQAAPTQPAPVSPGGALISGLAHGATFGTAPNIAGLAAASGMALPQQTETGALDQPAGMALLQPFVGAYKLATEGGDRIKAYNEAREQALKEFEQARAQHPYITAGGEIAGGLGVTPALGPLGALRAPTMLGRIGQGVKVGAVTGGLTGAGEAAGRGEAPAQVGFQGLAGAGSGAAIGGALGGSIEGVTGLASKIASLRRGQLAPELEAAKKVQEMFRGPGATAYQRVRSDVPALAAGSEAGAPLTLADFGGRAAGGLLRAATDISPEARDLASEQLGARYRQQAPRVIEWIQSKFGGQDTEGTTQALKTLAKRENAPAYTRAYMVAATRFPMGLASNELNGLVRASPTLRAALTEAAQQGSERAAAEGVGRSFMPRLQFDQAGNLSQFPDLQLWDYAQRILRDKARQLQQSGADSQAGALFGVHSQVLGELDRIAPEFAKARGTAATFFRANDALEAGQKFVGATDISDATAVRAIRKMSPAERSLFAQGFASELAQRLGARNYGADVLKNMFVDSPRASRRISIALGPDAAAQFEALMRIEGIMERTRAAIGNSQTSTNLQGLPMIGASIAGASEFIHSFNPAYVIGGALLLGGRQAARAIDEKVALNVAQMLLSDNPASIRRGYEVISRNPVMREALRRASDLGTRELLSLAGPYNVGAGLLTAGSRMTGAGVRAPETPPHRYYQEQEEQSVPSTLK